MAETVLEGYGLTWDKMLWIVEQTDGFIAAQARKVFLEDLHRKRAKLRCHFRRSGIKSSPNLLTFYGKSKNELAEMFRSLPTRITAAQFLAAFGLVPFIIREHVNLAATSAFSQISPTAARYMTKHTELSPSTRLKIKQQIEQEFQQFCKQHPEVEKYIQKKLVTARRTRLNLKRT